MKWKTLSSTVLFSDRWFSVRQETCEAPDGKIIDPYYIYDLPTWVAAVPVTADGKILLVRQYRHAIGEICLEIPGGCVDDMDPDFQSAISRELREETGYVFSSYDYLGKIAPNPSTNSNMLHMFLARGGMKVAEQQLDANEEIEVLSVTMDELKQLLRDKKIIQALHVACLHYALEKMNEPTC